MCMYVIREKRYWLPSSRISWTCRRNELFVENRYCKPSLSGLRVVVIFSALVVLLSWSAELHHDRYVTPPPQRIRGRK